MAESLKVTVAVEPVLHDAFGTVAQAIFQQHGVVVDRVEFSWSDLSTLSSEKPNIVLTQVEIVARKPYRGDE